MRSALALAVLAASGCGCVVTDYGAIDPSLNKTTGVTGCLSGDVFNTTVQTIVPQTQGMLYTMTDPSGAAVCIGDQPVPTTRRVTRQDAMDWNFCLAAFAQISQTQIFGGPGDGTWIHAGISDLQDGTVRINNFRAPGVYGSSCVFDGTDPGGPESTVVGEGWSEAGAPPRLPRLRPEVIALDRNPGGGCEYCANVMAMTPQSVTDGLTSYYCLNDRVTENRVRFTPSCRRDGPALLSGQPFVTTVADVQFTLRARLDADGAVSAELLGLEHAGLSYQAARPVAFRLDPESRWRSLEVHPSLEEERALARFALDAGLVDRPLQLPQVTEHGVPLPGGSLVISGAALRAFLDGSGG